VTAVAVQFGYSMTPQLPADMWVVEGTAGFLPRGVPLDGTWGALSNAYGRAIGDTDFGVTVMFCAHPRLFFDLSADLRDTGPITDFSLIPDSARITRVTIVRTRPGGWLCGD
jgi:hypothetical protein